MLNLFDRYKRKLSKAPSYLFITLKKTTFISPMLLFEKKISMPG